MELQHWRGCGENYDAVRQVEEWEDLRLSVNQAEEGVSHAEKYLRTAGDFRKAY